MDKLSDLARREKLAREMTHRPQAPIESLRGQDPLTDWALGMRERTLNPLSTLAGEAKRFQGLSPQEMGMELVGGGIAGTFIGKGAKTWKAAMKDTAEQMEKQGVAPEEIWKQTGTFRGADKEWRQEIPDDMAKMDFYTNLRDKENIGIKSQIADIVKKAGKTPTSQQKFHVQRLNEIMSSGEYRGTVGDVLKHKELSDAYGGIDQTKFSWMDMPSGDLGSMDDKGIALSKGVFGDDAKGTILHELQHAIQQREGWARGGNPETVFNSGTGAKGRDEQFAFAKQAYEKSHQTSGDPLLTELFSDVKPWESLTDRERLGWLDQGRNEAYRNLAGEAEARLTQARMNMTSEQRLHNYPPLMFDVPMENQIVRY